ncbi:MAG: hypothetical protein IPG50_07705 [Myxococcales bacterium]|nr:hypothetical protein [Myxococcales bacterium]
MTHRTLFCGAAILATLSLSNAALAQKKPKPKAPKTEEKAPEPVTEAPSADKAEEPKADAEGADKGDKDKAKNVEPPAEEWDDTDVTEKPGKTYYFVGLRYRGTIVPKFILNMFVDEGATFYSNTVGVEADIRKDGFSIIPALQYVEYGTDDILFKEKGKPDLSNNWSVVNSGLKGMYLTADLLWSTKVHKNWDFEYGAGFGLGVLFGNLQNNWVYLDPNGPLSREDGVRYSKCPSEFQNDLPARTGQATCSKPAHSNANEAKVGNYEEKFWTGGGSVPNVFIHLAIPQLGVRFKPRKDVQARFGLGFSLTGFWFGLSANYGLETALDKGKGGSAAANSESTQGPRLVTGQSLSPFHF